MNALQQDMVGLDEQISQEMARVMKALYKGISYLIHQEADICQAGSDIEILLGSMKQLMINYLVIQASISTREN